MKMNEAQETVQFDLSMVPMGDNPEKAFWNNKDWNIGP